MDLMPAEILSHILLLLRGSDRLRASFTCRRWLALLSNSLPRSIQVRISLDSSLCHALLSQSSDAETTVGICICEAHVHSHAVFLSYLFDCVANEIRSLVIDDDLICHETKSRQSTDEALHCILLKAPATIQELVIREADLSLVRFWTLGLLAKFDSLKEFSLIDCILPSCESFVLRLLSPSFDTLVTDKFASVIARRCPLVNKVDFSGCSQITALTLVAFCEAAFFRTAEMVFLGLTGTSFNYMKLRQYLNSSLLFGGRCWKASTMRLQIGFDRNAVCLENIRQRNLLIIAFV